MDFALVRSVPMGHNRGYKYIIFGYEETAKYVFALAMADKRDINVIKFLDGIIKKYHGIYELKSVYSDKAKEFSSGALKKFEKSRNITHYYTESEVRIIERRKDN